MRKTYFILFVCWFCLSVLAQAQNESDFYTETNHLGIVKNFVSDFGANANDQNDDSAVLQNAINSISSNPNGGKLILPEGVYYFSDVDLKSNVHLEIDSKVTIFPTPRIDTKNYKIFNLGTKNKLITNVSIRGRGGRFVVDLRKVTNINVGVFSCGNVENFLIADFIVLDKLTKFSAINCGIQELNGEYNLPKNGIIKNGEIRNAHYGYGLIQTQAAQNILFKNLSGKGGVTLRWETGYDKMNALQVGGVFNMVARNISCEDGNAAIMISPHAIKNGHVEADTVYAKNCGFAVRIGNGYVKASQESLGITPGSFANTSWLKNVTAVYGDSAQLKSKHFKYMPCELRSKPVELPPDSHNSVPIYSGPSIAAVLNQAEGTGPGKYSVSIANAQGIGFEYQPKAVVTVEDENDCTGNATGLKTTKINSGVKIFPNPFFSEINIELPSNHNFNTLEILDSIGKVIYLKKVVQGEKKLKLFPGKNKLKKGLYFIKLKGENIDYQKKLIKNQ